MKGAIVGFGEVARHGHWPAYASNRQVTIAAVVDRTAERRGVAQTLIPGVAVFETLDELADAMEIDFIDICTPPALHPAPMLRAIERGWHVLCEKPFVLDPAVLEIVRQRALAKRVAVVPVHNWKYAPIIRNATARCRMGLIGVLQRVELEVSRLRAAPTADAAYTSNWRRDPAIAGGGILMDHGWHAVYLALDWFRQSPREIASVLHWPEHGGVEDEAAVTLTFPHGVASIRLTWNGYERRNRVLLAGELGEIVIDDDTLSMTGPFPMWLKMPRALSAGSHHDDWFAAMLPDVLAAFRNPALAAPLFEEAVSCLGVIREAYERDVSLRQTTS